MDEDIAVAVCVAQNDCDYSTQSVRIELVEWGCICHSGPLHMLNILTYSLGVLVEVAVLSLYPKPSSVWPSWLVAVVSEWSHQVQTHHNGSLCFNHQKTNIRYYDVWFFLHHPLATYCTVHHIRTKKNKTKSGHAHTESLNTSYSDDYQLFCLERNTQNTKCHGIRAINNGLCVSSAIVWWVCVLYIYIFRMCVCVCAFLQMDWIEEALRHGRKYKTEHFSVVCGHICDMQCNAMHEMVQIYRGVVNAKVKLGVQRKSLSIPNSFIMHRMCRRGYRKLWLSLCGTQSMDDLKLKCWICNKWIF